MKLSRFVAYGRLLPWLSGLDLEVSKGKACFWGPLGQWGMVDGPPAGVFLNRWGWGPGLCHCMSLVSLSKTSFLKSEMCLCVSGARGQGSC